MDNNTVLILGVMICILGFGLVFLIYYFWKVRVRSDLGSYTSFGKERRKYFRTNISWPVSIETPDRTIEGEIINISHAGAFICCNKPLPLGKVFRVTMIGPNNEPVMATAEVIWSNINVPDEKVINRGMGVRFIKMSDRHIQLVKQILGKGD